MRTLGFSAACLGSLALLVTGLIGPLTPSEVCPRVLELLLFWGAPVLLPLVAGIRVRAQPVQVLFFTQSTAIAAFVALLLDRIGCLW